MSVGTESDLVAESPAGLHDWEALYRSYGRVMWAAARKVLRDPQRSYAGTSVEDVVQQAMLELQRAGIGPEVRSIPRHVATVAARRALNALRAAAWATATGSGLDGDIAGEEQVESAVALH